MKDSFVEPTPSVDEAQPDSAYGTNTRSARSAVFLFLLCKLIEVSVQRTFRCSNAFEQLLSLEQTKYNTWAILIV